MIQKNVIRKWHELRGIHRIETMLEILSIYPLKECEPPFSVDFVSEAKCHESVLDAGMPRMEMKNTSSHQYLSRMLN